jgi:hypothetical protein
VRIKIDVDVAGTQVRAYNGEIRWTGVSALVAEAVDQLRYTQDGSGCPRPATVTVNDWDSRVIVTASLEEEEI